MLQYSGQIRPGYASGGTFVIFLKNALKINRLNIYGYINKFYKGNKK